MNDRFPDATPEELNAWVVCSTLLFELCLINFLCCVIYMNWCSYRSDATCIICREEMTTAKRLSCGHLFHVHCLRSWLERQHTCPTCRALVAPPENGTTTSGSQASPHQQGNHIPLLSVHVYQFLIYPRCNKLRWIIEILRSDVWSWDCTSNWLVYFFPTAQPVFSNCFCHVLIKLKLLSSYQSWPHPLIKRF